MLKAVVLALIMLAAPAAYASDSDPPRARAIGEGFRRGRAVDVHLVDVGGAWLAHDIAQKFLAMQAAAADDGVELYVRSGFRTFEQQRYLYAIWRAGLGSKAARPGHSNHQLGRAADIYLAEGVYAWLNQNARRFGFRRTVSSEPWHWEARPGRVKRVRRR
ncbi:MAG: D-alanyl-D-alanine carboxypeptidase family protein [Deltaproteobacteria bacterium]|nr:D-alanyl-D-alanine carboxypeptidase family protein [Deltaproteobacteria bacterium]